MNEFIDVEFEDESNRNIRGKVMYYSTGQVAKLLNQTPSKMNYYTTFFNEFLNIKKSNSRNQYTEQDIEKLRYIIDLTEGGMKLQQVKEYCQEVDFNGDKPVVKETNPLGVQAIAKALMEEQTKQITQMKEELKTELAQAMKHEVLEKLELFLENQKEFQMLGFEVLKEDIEKRVNDTVSEKLDNVTNSINEIKESMSMKFVSREEIESYNKKKTIWSYFLGR